MSIALGSLNDKTSITGSEKIPVSGSGNPSLTPILMNFGSVNQQTDSYTLVLTDAFKQVEISKATDINLTVPPNASVAFPTGTEIRIKRTGVGIITVVQGAGVTVTGSAGVLTDAGLNVVMSLKKTGTNTWDLQNGSPDDEKAWSPTFTGYASAPTNVIAFYQMVKPKLCYFRMWMFDPATSNATTLTFTLPFVAKTGSNQPSLVIAIMVNGGSNVANTGRALLSAGSNVVSCFTNMSNAAWTNTGDKRIFMSGMYVTD